MNDIVTTLRHWVEAIRIGNLASKVTIADIALMNGGCITEDMELAAAEIERLQAQIARMEILTGPDAFRYRWLGQCGHEWRKDQSEHCPICERDLLAKRAALEQKAVEK